MTTAVVAATTAGWRVLANAGRSVRGVRIAYADVARGTGLAVRVIRAVSIQLFNASRCATGTTVVYARAACCLGKGPFGYRQ